MGMVFEYSGYVGSVEYDDSDKIFHGRVQGISDVVAYEGATVDDLEEDFMDAGDSYLIGLVKMKPKSKIEARTYSHEEVLLHLRKRHSLRRMYPTLDSKLLTSLAFLALCGESELGQKEKGQVR